MAEPIRNITIVGGGTSGWVAATFLASAFRKKMQAGEMGITLIESPNIGIIGVGESTARPMADLLRFVGIKESEFIKRCDATFKLSGWFHNWDKDENGNGVSWVNPFFSQDQISGLNPGYLFSKFGMNEDGTYVDEDFSEAMSVCPAIIRAHKGPRPLGNKDYQSEIPYSYHMNAIELAKMLAERGKELGVKQILDDVLEVRLDDKGFVRELELKENGPHPIEFVIDGTGFASIIMGKALGEPFQSYDNFLLNDRAAVMQLPHEDPTRIEPTSRATGMDAGWAFRVPLYNRIGTGYIYSSKFLSDDEAVEEFRRHAGPRSEEVEPRIIRMRIGKVRRSWVKNCVALGLSSGFVEPLEATAIYSVQVALQWLVGYFPDSDFSPAMQKRYNTLVNGLYAEIVDYIAMLFHISNREDTPYWQAVKHEMEIPERLKENLDLWKHTMPEEIDLETHTFFSPGTWRAALMGKRYYKGRDYPQAMGFPKEHWDEYLTLRRNRTDKFLKELPDHYTLLRRIRGEDAPVQAGLSTSFNAQPNWSM